MNLSLIHLVFWLALVWLGWWLRGRYGAQLGAAVAPLTADPEELEVLRIFREAKAKDEAEAARKRQEDLRAKLAGKFAQP